MQSFYIFFVSLFNSHDESFGSVLPMVKKIWGPPLGSKVKPLCNRKIIKSKATKPEVIFVRWCCTTTKTCFLLESSFKVYLK